MNDGNLAPIFVLPNLYESAEKTQDLISRFEQYSSAFLEVNQGFESGLIVMAGVHSEIEFQQNQRNLRLIRVSNPTRNSLVFAVRVVSNLRSLKIRPSIYVAGNLYFGFLAAFLANKISPSVGGIQISFHGSSLNAKDSYVKSFIRRRFLQYVISNSNSVRVVSEHVKRELFQMYEIDFSKVFVSPIPVQIPLQSIAIEQRRKSIVFLGRMQAERGVDEWIQIIHLLYAIRKDFNIILIGDGPERLSFLRELNSISPDLEINDFGKIKNKEVAQVLQSSKIFFSSALKEGYGLALREALLNGCLVCARDSDGSRAAGAKWPELVKLYGTPDEGVHALSYLLDHEFAEPLADSVVKQIEHENRSSIKQLVRSWAT